MSSARTAGFLVFVALLWGIPFAFTDVALHAGASPIFTAWVRVIIGAFVLAVVAHRRRAWAGVPKHWMSIAIVGLCDIAFPFAVVPIAQQHLSSSLAGILIATTPVFVALLAVSAGLERLRSWAWIGLVLALGGVGLILGPSQAGDIWAGLLALSAAFSYGLATILVRRLSDVSPLAVSAAGLIVASVALTPLALMDLRAPRTYSGWTALVLLGLLSTAAAIGLFYGLVARIGATRASLSLYLAPVFAVILGAVLLGDKITVITLAGFVLILLGATLVDRYTLDRRNTPPRNIA